MRKAIIAGNWKMNMTPGESEVLVKALIPLVKNASCEVVVCPPFVDLFAVKPLIEGTNIKLGAQNVHWAQKGAFTGEISADMLKSLGVSHAIIGHSERRQYFGETDETVNMRATAAIAAGLTPIICVGESLEQREAGETDAWVSGQTTAALKDISAEDAAKLVIAYEPIWAIGTGKTATSGRSQPKRLRHYPRQDRRNNVRNSEAAQKAIRIQYGGSMNPKNVAELMERCLNIDGGLIGGASVESRGFFRTS